MYSAGQQVRVLQTSYDDSDGRLLVEKGDVLTVVQAPHQNRVYCKNDRYQQGYVALQQVESMDFYPPPPSPIALISTPCPPTPAGGLASASPSLHREPARTPTPNSTRVSSGLSRASSISGASFTETVNFGEDYEDNVVHYEVCTDFRSSTPGSLTVAAGEVVVRVTDASSQVYEDPLDRVLVESLHTGRRGRVARSCLIMVEPIYAERWFVGRMPRAKAERLLLASAGDTFLIRQSESTEEYVISMTPPPGRGVMQVRHRKIIEEDGQFLAWAPQRFPSLQQLVDAHTTKRGGNQLSTPYDKFSAGLN